MTNMFDKKLTPNEKDLIIKEYIGVAKFLIDEFEVVSRELDYIYWFRFFKREKLLQRLSAINYLLGRHNIKLKKLRSMLIK